MKNMFLCNSGAEANECAIKIARKYSFDKYGKGRHNIITLVNSFHGRTLCTLSATGQDVFHNYFFPFVDGHSVSPFLVAVTERVCADTAAKIYIRLAVFVNRLVILALVKNNIQPSV